MTQLEETIAAHPSNQNVDAGRTAELILILNECAQTCIACADACLDEPMVGEMRLCIASDLNCATVCRAMADLLTRQAHTGREVLHSMGQACVEACRVCAEECEKHASEHAHCEHCARICRDCEAACRSMPRP